MRIARSAAKGKSDRRGSRFWANPIENVQETLAKVSRNVKRRRNGNMALRWGVTRLLVAEAKFRRIKGHHKLPQFLAALNALAARRFWTPRPRWRRTQQ